MPDIHEDSSKFGQTEGQNGFIGLVELRVNGDFEWMTTLEGRPDSFDVPDYAKPAVANFMNQIYKGEQTWKQTRTSQGIGQLVEKTDTEKRISYGSPSNIKRVHNGQVFGLYDHLGQDDYAETIERLVFIKATEHLLDEAEVPINLDQKLSIGTEIRCLASVLLDEMARRASSLSETTDAVADHYIGGYETTVDDTSLSELMSLVPAIAALQPLKALLPEMFLTVDSYTTQPSEKIKTFKATRILTEKERNRQFVRTWSDRNS